MNTSHDYEHALLEIRHRLHDTRPSKAAVMIGAGFSRNARHRSDPNKKLPDWSELTRGLAERLYPNPDELKNVLKQAGATSSAARLAQEFETAFRRVGLVGFIRDSIRDDEFVPSDVHRKLLEIPWADVFTTNYDRLLEKTNVSLVMRSYEPVLSIKDLPLTQRPRIVKLHGTLPGLDHLVLTEEDYRAYPKCYAPFVTTVQAALTENVLCLIGFSGDDPNFLAWTGWLRDEMRSAVPNTYLFTKGELKPFQRQLLEERHVIPIPLERIAPRNNNFNYDDAYLWLFNELKRPPGPQRPSWNVGPRYAQSRFDSSIAKEPFSPSGNNWIDAAILWKAHREQFKGWHVLYRDGADRLWSNTEFWTGELNSKLVDDWAAPISLFVLHEVVWRWSAALRPLVDPFVFQILDPQMKRFAEWRTQATKKVEDINGASRSIEIPLTDLDDAYEMLLRECLRHAREIGDDARFNTFVEQLEQPGAAARSTPMTNSQSYLRYQQVLHSLGRLKEVNARERLESWDTSLCDPIWAARRASLCLECGLIELGIQLLESTLERLRSLSVSPILDIRNKSAEGVTLYLLFAAQSASENSSNRKINRLPQPSDSGRSATAWIEGTTPSQRGMEQNPLRKPESKLASEKPKTPPEQKEMLDRLTDLGNDGCDPNDLKEWLEAATSPEPRATKGKFRVEGFDIGAVSSNLSDGDEPQLKAAYRSMRFLEDAALPIAIPLEIRTTVAAQLFRGAMKTIAFFAPHEAVGLVLRARETGLVEEVFSRDCLAKLSTDQIQSLFDTGVTAIREALSNLGSPPQTREVEDEFWDTQFQVACSLLSRVVVRLQDNQIRELLIELIALPQDGRIRDRWQSQEQLRVCIYRAIGSLGKDTFAETLPLLLATPVRGSKEFPTASDRLGRWQDPLLIVSSFFWKPTTPIRLRCREQVDELLAGIATAQGEERANLCIRAAYLMDAGLLSLEEVQKFAESLFTKAKTDEQGLPTETGCLDALVLSFPRWKQLDEVAAFRAKHCTASALADKSLWRDLRRTHVLARPGRRKPARNLSWQRRDLTAILDLAETWISSAKPPTKKKSQAELFSESMTNQSEELQVTFLDWLATLENVVLINKRANQQQRDRAEAIVVKAQQAGWCVAQVVAARAFLGYVPVVEAISEIRSCLGNRQPIIVRQACDAVGRWCQLGQSHGFSVPTELSEMLAALVTERRHESLSLLICACMDVIEISGGQSRTSLLSAISDGLRELLTETDYSAEDDVSPFSVGMKLRIRVACGRLAIKVSNLGLSTPVIDQWIAVIQEDKFADVRRELHI